MKTELVNIDRTWEDFKNKNHLLVPKLTNVGLQELLITKLLQVKNRSYKIPTCI